MRKVFIAIAAAACCALLASQPVRAQFDKDFLDAMRDAQEVQVVKEADSVTCKDFEVIVNRDCDRQGVQFVILSKGKYAPYRPSMVGDTLYLEMLRRGVPRLPTVIPHVPIDRGQTVRTIPLRVIFGDTAWVEVAYAQDSVRVAVVDSVANVSIHEAQLLSPALLPPVFIPKNKGTADIMRYLKKKRGELEKLGEIICLPAGYYQCFTEPLAVLRLGRNDSVNELAGQKLFFVQLTDTSASARSMALHILGGSE